MNKNLFKKSTATFLCALMLIPSVLSVNAAGITVTTTEIPIKMAPKSTIQFITDTEYTVLEGGEYDDSAAYAQMHVDQIINEDNNSLEDTENIIREEPVSPKAGMVVTYADDGYILKIQINSQSAGSEYANCPRCGKSYLSNGKTSPNGTYTWGSHSNKLVVKTNSVKGTGRFTTFSDSVGQDDKTLVKGHVATRYHVDNPSYGSKVSCTANGFTKSMTKYDVGCLPDGVLDIWKTGVEYFGYKYNSSLSIDNATYSYSK